MNEFKIQTEQFADIRILRYQVPGFENLSLNKKRLIYFLAQSALWGRDIIYDQNYKHNLLIRHNLENILKSYKGDRTSLDFQKFLVYLKRAWFSNGIHHHYSMDKFFPECSEDYFAGIMMNSHSSGFKHFDNEPYNIFVEQFIKLIYNKDLDNKRVSLDSEKDLILNSACNFYEQVNQHEAEAYYAEIKNKDNTRPISTGLNSKLIKQNGEIEELTYKIGGLYSGAIEKMVFFLEKALPFAENDKQKNAISLLVKFYKSGDLHDFDEYSLAWLKDTESAVDIIHGFIETYGDPLGKKATFEALVSIRDEEATKRAKIISEHALWFELNSSTSQNHKKDKVEGVNATAIYALMESGDCSPSTPIGVNLPNADWIRAEYGSKSVTISNIIDAYDLSSKDNGVVEEFCFSDEEVRIDKEYSSLASKLHVDLHEIIGHGSGKLEKGVADPSETLKNYASTIEETRADLVALYFALHPKLIDLGLMPSIITGKAEYNSFIRSSLLTQLVRVELGKNIEESHMRNRYLIANWVYEKAKEDQVIEKIISGNKTYFVIRNYEKLNLLFGELLKEVQRIKSSGDYHAAKHLVESYGVKVNKDIHLEVLERWKKLNIAAYAGFINPDYHPVYEKDEIIDVLIEYPDDFSNQMINYSRNYSSLI